MSLKLTDNHDLQGLSHVTDGGTMHFLIFEVSFTAQIRAVTPISNLANIPTFVTVVYIICFQRQQLLGDLGLVNPAV